MGHAHPHSGNRLFGQVAHELGWRSGPKLSRGYPLVGRQCRAGSQHGISFNHAAVHDGGAQADKGAVFQCCAVQHHHMTDQSVVANYSGVSIRCDRIRAVAVDGRAILNIAARTDADEVYISTNHAIIPYARFRADLDVADYLASGRDKGGFVNSGRLAIEGQYERIGHLDLSVQ